MDKIYDIVEKFNKDFATKSYFGETGTKELEEINEELLNLEQELKDLLLQVTKETVMNKNGLPKNDESIEIEPEKMGQFYNVYNLLSESIRTKLVEIDKALTYKKSLSAEKRKRWGDLGRNISLNDSMIEKLEKENETFKNLISSPYAVEDIKNAFQTKIDANNEIIKTLKDKNEEYAEERSKLQDEFNIIRNGGKLPENASEKSLEPEEDKLDEEIQKDSDEPDKSKEEENDRSSDSESTSEDLNDEIEQENEEQKQEEPPQIVPTEEGDSKDKDDEPSLVNPLNDTQKEETPSMPTKKGNKPKVTWKTIASIAAGVGIGGAVFFTAGPVGVAVMTIAGTIGNKIINNQRLKLARLGSEVAIDKIEEPRPGIRGKFDKFKNYLKSDEGLRDMSSLIGAAIITGNALNVASAIQNVVASNTPVPEPMPIEPGTTPTPVEPTPLPVEPTPVVDTITPTPEITPYDNIVIGENVGSYNVSVGHDTAAWAVNGTNTETLLSQYVNGDSVFKSFASINPDGTVGQIINTDGLSITEFCAQNGLDINSVAVDVARGTDNASQAWVSASELIKGVGGPTI